MLNYVKSEFYRVLHGKAIYGLTGVLSGLTVLFNFILYAFGTNQAFGYDTIRFSLNMMTGSLPLLMGIALIVVSYIAADEYKNGTLKNVVAYGISRNTFFTGKCIVSMVISILCMFVVLGFYIGSALLLLENDGMEPVWELLKGIGASVPAALAALVLSVLLYCLFKKEITVVMIWGTILFLFPQIAFFLGFKIEFFKKAAEWMPYNFLRFEAAVNMSGYECLWNTPEGIMKCIVSGAIGMIVFYTAGILLFRRKEIN